MHHGVVSTCDLDRHRNEKKPKKTDQTSLNSVTAVFVRTMLRIWNFPRRPLQAIGTSLRPSCSQTER